MDQMRTVYRVMVFLTLTSLVINAFGSQRRRAAQAGSAEATSLTKKIRRFAPTVLTANTARLSPNDRKALQKIIAAAKLYDHFYVIRRDASGKLKPVSYSEEYEQYLKPAAQLLNEAGRLATNQTLKNFLFRRAVAFNTNDYYDSDVAWTDLDSPIDLTMGPYE